MQTDQRAALRRRPLHPLETLTNLLTWLLAMGVVLLAMGSMLIAGGDVGSPQCTVVPGAAADDLLTGGGPAVRGLRPGADASVDALEICGFGAGLVSYLRALAPFMPHLMLAIALVALLHVLLRRATRSGLFSVDVVRTVRLIGWVLILGSILAELATAVAETGMLNYVVPGSFGVLALVSYVEIPLTAIIGGVAILTAARVLRLAVALRQDVDATI